VLGPSGGPVSTLITKWWRIISDANIKITLLPFPDLRSRLFENFIKYTVQFQLHVKYI